MRSMGFLGKKIMGGAPRHTTRAIGQVAEDRALACLVAAGLVLVERNYRTPGRGGGEIDLVMRERDGTLVFVEVRSRGASAYGGAGGSIGSELCRQIVQQGPRRLLLVEHSEFALYQIDKELQALAATQPQPPDVVALLGDVRDLRRMRQIIGSYRPATLYHAAAYKHVPMVEHNPVQGIGNNVFGTLTVARAALEARVARFVLVSTDKAVRPTNIMGASKRLAELCLQALAASETVDFEALDAAMGHPAAAVCCFRFLVKASNPGDQLRPLLLPG